MRLVFYVLIAAFHSCFCENIVPPAYMSSTHILFQDETLMARPNFAQLDTYAKSNISHHPDFIQTCKEMTGYYKDPTRNPSLNNTIFMGGINYAYRDFLHNFKCYTDRLGLKFLPIALDQQIYSYITRGGISPSFSMPDLPSGTKVDSKASGWNSGNFNLIGCRKLEVVGGALTLGYDVIFSDVDIALLVDPIKYLLFEGMDYVHSDNMGCMSKEKGNWTFHSRFEGNTGFYSIRSNPRTIRQFDLAFKTCSIQNKFDDQTLFWYILRTNTNPLPEPVEKCPKPGQKYTRKDSTTLTSCPLDSCQFSAGNLRDEYDSFNLMVNTLKERRQPPVMVHANYFVGKVAKKHAMHKAGLWLTHKENGFEDVGELEPVGNWICTIPHNSSALVHLSHMYH